MVVLIVMVSVVEVVVEGVVVNVVAVNVIVNVVVMRVVGSLGVVSLMVYVAAVRSVVSMHDVRRSRDCKRMVAVRRSRTTRVIVKLLFVYLVCVIPVCVFNLYEAPNPGKHKDVGIALYCLYWMQYCVNNFIYVVSNGRYRCAYYQFLCWVTCRRPLPPTPGPHWQPHSGQVYTIHSSNTLQQPLDLRFRTPSECEEARRRVNSSFFDSLKSTANSNGSLKEAVHSNLCVSLSPDSCFSLRFHSPSLSSTSSLQTLVKTQQRPRHLSHSVKRDLKAAGHRLRRTFSC